MSRSLRLAAQAVAFSIGAVVLGCGVPVGWLWVASQIQGAVGGSTDALAALALVLGIPSTYAALGVLGHLLDRRAGNGKRRQQAWNRPIGGDGQSSGTGSRVETLFVATTLLVAVGVEVHLLFFAHPGVRSGP